jgi:hypothetical protein
MDEKSRYLELWERDHQHFWITLIAIFYYVNPDSSELSVSKLREILTNGQIYDWCPNPVLVTHSLSFFIPSLLFSLSPSNMQFPQ